LSRGRLELLRGKLGQPHLARHSPREQLRLEPLRGVAILEHGRQIGRRDSMPLGHPAGGRVRSQQDKFRVPLALDVVLPMVRPDRAPSQLDCPLRVPVVKVHYRRRDQPVSAASCRRPVGL
jgi:hypothetical protein